MKEREFDTEWLSGYGPELEEAWAELEDDYSSNAPCDTYGMCAGSSCKHYYECHK